MKGNGSLMLLLLKQLISQADEHEAVFESMAESFTGSETECNLGHIMLPVRDPMEV